MGVLGVQQVPPYVAGHIGWGTPIFNTALSRPPSVGPPQCRKATATPRTVVPPHRGAVASSCTSPPVSLHMAMGMSQVPSSQPTMGVQGLHLVSRSGPPVSGVATPFVATPPAPLRCCSQARKPSRIRSGAATPVVKTPPVPLRACCMAQALSPASPVPVLGGLVRSTSFVQAHGSGAASCAQPLAAAWPSTQSEEKNKDNAHNDRDGRDEAPAAPAASTTPATTLAPPATPTPPATAPLEKPISPPLSTRDLDPWIESARHFELNTDFDISHALEQGQQLSLDAVMNVMKAESAGKWTIQVLADKAVLHGILANMGMPQMPAHLVVQGPTVERREIENCLRDHLCHTNGTDIVVKPTHMSNVEGVVFMSRPQKGEEGVAQSVDFVEKHMLRFMERRASAHESKALQSLRPGFIVQPKYEPILELTSPLELRVVVLWGRARMAVWWWGRPGQAQGQRASWNTWMVRVPARKGQLSDEEDTWEAVHQFTGNEASFRQALRTFHQHMPGVAGMAEALAIAVGAPFLRCDFFVGSPHWGARLNEVAYGSGLDYVCRADDGSRRLINDAPAIARVLQEGSAVCQCRRRPETFLTRLGVVGQGYDDMSVKVLRAGRSHSTSKLSGRSLETQEDSQSHRRLSRPQGLGSSSQTSLSTNGRPSSAREERGVQDRDNSPQQPQLAKEQLGQQPSIMQGVSMQVPPGTPHLRTPGSSVVSREQPLTSSISLALTPRRQNTPPFLMRTPKTSMPTPERGGVPLSSKTRQRSVSGGRSPTNTYWSRPLLLQRAASGETAAPSLWQQNREREEVNLMEDHLSQCGISRSASSARLAGSEASAQSTQRSAMPLPSPVQSQAPTGVSIGPPVRIGSCVMPASPRRQFWAHGGGPVERGRSPTAISCHRVLAAPAPISGHVPGRSLAAPSSGHAAWRQCLVRAKSMDCSEGVDGVLTPTVRARSASRSALRRSVPGTPAQSSGPVSAVGTPAGRSATVQPRCQTPGPATPMTPSGYQKVVSAQRSPVNPAASTTANVISWSRQAAAQQMSPDVSSAPGPYAAQATVPNASALLDRLAAERDASLSCWQDELDLFERRALQLEDLLRKLIQNNEEAETTTLEGQVASASQPVS